MRKLLFVTLALCLLALSGCQKEEPAVTVPNPEVTIQLTDGSKMRLELYPYTAPNTVANFVNLIEQGFYDGLTFHRVVFGFMIQGGDPLGTGTGGPGYAIKGEFSENGVKNDLSHTRGVLSMARSRDYNSAGSQFFIMHGDAPYLDGQYAAFGKLLDEESYDTLDKIAATATDAKERPQIAYTIEKMTVDTKGYQYTVVKYEK